MIRANPPVDLAATGSFTELPESRDMAEKVLLERSNFGDRTALEALYFLYFERLAKFIEHVTLRSDCVEDLINDTMLTVLNGSGAIGTASPISVLIMQAAYLNARQWLADGTNNATLDSSLDLSSATDTWNSDKRMLFSRLAPEERAVLHLAYGNGCSRREAADILRLQEDDLDALVINVRRQAKAYFDQTLTASQ